MSLTNLEHFETTTVSAAAYLRGSLHFYGGEFNLDTGKLTLDSAVDLDTATKSIWEAFQQLVSDERQAIKAETTRELLEFSRSLLSLGTSETDPRYSQGVKDSLSALTNKLLGISALT